MREMVFLRLGQGASQMADLLARFEEPPTTPDLMQGECFALVCASDGERRGSYDPFELGSCSRQFAECVGLVLDEYNQLVYDHWQAGVRLRGLTYFPEAGGWKRAQGQPELWEATLWQPPVSIGNPLRGQAAAGEVKGTIEAASAQPMISVLKLFPILAQQLGLPPQALSLAPLPAFDYGGPRSHTYHRPAP